MKAGTICCYCISKRRTKKALQNHCIHTQIRARLTACEVGREISTLENTPTLLIEKPLKFIAHGRIFKSLW